MFSAIFAQENSKKIIYTGNLSTDAKNVLAEYEQPIRTPIMPNSQDKKSPVLAGFLSLLVPGAGEIYSGEYLKAGIFVVLEASVVTTAVIYNNKGNQKTDEFQNYADNNWSVVKYAEWLNTNADGQISISSNTNLPPWERVNWIELNNAERNAGEILGGGFSHALPPHGDQQYFELIGKYKQYSVGWDDYDTQANGINWFLTTPNMLSYASERGKANDLYSVASTAVIGIYVNHFLSALDAVWSSIQHNKDLALKVRLENMQLTQNHAEFYPVLHLSYNF